MNSASMYMFLCNYVINYKVESDIASEQTPEVSTLCLSCTSFVWNLPCNSLKEYDHSDWNCKILLLPIQMSS